MSPLTFDSTFESLPAASILADARMRQQQGWRYVQTLAVNKDDGVDLVYAYMDMSTGKLVNLVVSDVAHGATVSSITEAFFEAFVFENEIHDLFGITFDGLALDFNGNFYRLASDKPMTVISPEQLAEREKQRKIAAAKAAKAAKAKEAAAGEGQQQPAEGAATKASAAAAENADAEMEAKLAAMDPEKAAKVRAAMKAKAAKAARAAKEAEAAATASASEATTADPMEKDVIEVEDGKGGQRNV